MLICLFIAVANAFVMTSLQIELLAPNLLRLCHWTAAGYYQDMYLQCAYVFFSSMWQAEMIYVAYCQRAAVC